MSFGKLLLIGFISFTYQLLNGQAANIRNSATRNANLMSRIRRMVPVHESFRHRGCNAPAKTSLELVRVYRESNLTSTTLFQTEDCRNCVPNLEIESWLRAYRKQPETCRACWMYNEAKNDGSVVVRNAVSGQASTLVTVWNNQIKQWQKIKVTVGLYCYIRD